ncbi:MAG: hypothetical protein Q4G26_09495 [Paracoccus sp. (in: a-proteobacteria)]|nr:hypothetical protein [Paracoccus sp. (in: a-proteobacteria)]
MLAAALPQRARALAHLAFDQTLIMLASPMIEIRLPGSVIKERESRKATVGYHNIIQNADLWSALNEYRRDFRKLFDDGGAMFPSTLRQGSSLSSGEIGKQVGDLTERHLGVRVSIHRVRDNVATESSEELRDGAYLAPALLGHRNADTARRHYDHSTGAAATKDYGEALSERRSRRSTLRL